MSKLAPILTGLVIGLSLFFSFASMVAQSSGASIFVYQGF
jgi:hypothetical protein